MIVDWHCHWLSPALSEALRIRQEPPCITRDAAGAETLVLPHGALRFTRAYYDVDEQRVAMRADGVERQVLSLPGLFGVDTLPADVAAPLLRAYNDELAARCAEAPQTFSAVAALPLADPAHARAELERSLDALGLIGAILPIEGFRTPEQAAVLRPLLEVLDARGAHLFLHPGPLPAAQRLAPPPAPAATADALGTALRHTVLGVQASISEAMVTLCLTPALDDFPALTVQVANLGGAIPFFIERMDQLQALRAPEAPRPGTRLRRVYVDTATFGPKAVRLAAEVFGPDRLLFGSDAPIFDRAVSLAGARDAGVLPAMAETARALLERAGTRRAQGA